MMTQRRRSVSWELVGILGILTLFLVGGLIWITSPAGRGELVTPDHRTQDPTLQLLSGFTDDGRPYLGRPDAPVTYYAFEDFQCPHCRSFSVSGFRTILRDYLVSGKARMIWVSLGHDGVESIAAARAALCAGEQGKFWDSHDWLFANQSAIPNRGGFARDRLTAIAGRIGLDLAVFGTCLDSPGTAARIEVNDAFAREKSVSVTPAFLVGDRVIEGGDATSLAAALDAAAGE